MDDAMIAGHFENLDRRLNRVEQFLPTLATKDELLAAKGERRLAIAEAVAPLATKEDLKTLATKEDLKTLATKEELREEGERSRHHMEILIEGQRTDIQLLAEHLSVVMSRLTDQ